MPHRMRSFWCGLFAAALGIAGLLPDPAQAALTIRITQGIEGAIPIAVVPFGREGPAGREPADIGAIIANDLARSGRFAPLHRDELPARPRAETEVRFSDWRLLGTENLVVGTLAPRTDGTYAIRFRLFDVFRGEQLAGYSLHAQPAELRRAAHQISDIIYEKLTGERGAFSTRIAYVTETRRPGNPDDRRYALNVADTDGENAQVILESSQPLLSPAWSSDARKLAYVSFEGRRPRVYIQNLATGKREQITSFPGLNSAPAWSPDNAHLALTLSKDGNAEIYVLNLATRRLRRLTNNTAIDTEPAWAPDGQSLVFTSDRGGTPQIYRISAYGGRAKRLTFDGSYNARATFAPDGNTLALVHGDKGAYRIGLLDLRNGALQSLTDTRLDESPSFAPNGSLILYATTDSGGSVLAAVSVDGGVRHRLAVQEGDVREPAWSPFRDSK